VAYCPEHLPDGYADLEPRAGRMGAWQGQMREDAGTQCANCRNPPPRLRLARLLERSVDIMIVMMRIILIIIMIIIIIRGGGRGDAVCQLPHPPPPGLRLARLLERCDMTWCCLHVIIKIVIIIIIISSSSSSSSPSLLNRS
jgi:hypothetical protein